MILGNDVTFQKFFETRILEIWFKILGRFCDFVSGEHNGTGSGTILAILGNDVTFQEQSRRFLEMTPISRNFSEPKS